MKFPGGLKPCAAPPAPERRGRPPRRQRVVHGQGRTRRRHRAVGKVFQVLQGLGVRIVVYLPNASDELLEREPARSIASCSRKWRARSTCSSACPRSRSTTTRHARQPPPCSPSTRSASAKSKRNAGSA
ncbi:hypothetical protein EMIT0111MI5_70138 [Burkholderia sp. IT-111MI5]